MCLCVCVSSIMSLIKICGIEPVWLAQHRFNFLETLSWTRIYHTYIENVIPIRIERLLFGAGFRLGIKLRFEII